MEFSRFSRWHSDHAPLCGGRGQKELCSATSHGVRLISNTKVCAACHMPATMMQFTIITQSNNLLAVWNQLGIISCTTSHREDVLRSVKFCYYCMKSENSFTVSDDMIERISAEYTLFDRLRRMGAITILVTTVRQCRHGT